MDYLSSKEKNSKSDNYDGELKVVIIGFKQVN